MGSRSEALKGAREPFVLCNFELQRAHFHYTVERHPPILSLEPFPKKRKSEFFFERKLQPHPIATCFPFVSSTFTFTSLALTRVSDISRVLRVAFKAGGESEFKASAVEDGKKLSILQPRDAGGREAKCGKTFAFPPCTQTCEHHRSHFPFLDRKSQDSKAGGRKWESCVRVQQECSRSVVLT